ncbi:hypothetical protein GF324_13835 [bacterium]|nr:hypothetical protein [bacterium]
MLCLLAVGFVPTQAQEKDAPPLPLDVVPLLEEAVSPEIAMDVGEAREGRWRMSDHWDWMFFLHARPLEGLNVLSLEEARRTIAANWSDGRSEGKLTGAEGRIALGDHTLYWVEALILDGSMLTRFYLWDDVEEGRRLVADTNIDVSLGTPDSLLKRVQREMTVSVAASMFGIDYKTPKWLAREERYTDLHCRLLYPPLSTPALLSSAVHPVDHKPSKDFFSLTVRPIANNRRYDVRWGPQPNRKMEPWLQAMLPDSFATDGKGRDVDIRVEVTELDEFEDNLWRGQAVVRLQAPDVKPIERTWRVGIARWKYRRVEFRALLAIEEVTRLRGMPFQGEVPDLLFDRRMADWLRVIHGGPSWPIEID